MINCTHVITRQVSELRSSYIRELNQENLLQKKTDSGRKSYCGMWKGRFHWMRSNLPAMLLFDWYNLDHKSLTQLEPTHILQLSPAEQHHFVHTVHMYVIVCTAKKYRFKHVPLDITCSLIKSKILWYCKSGMSSLFLMSSFKRVPFFLNKTSAFLKLTLSSPVYIHPTHLQTPLSCIALGG